jgi:hypothetical protein
MSIHHTRKGCEGCKEGVKFCAGCKTHKLAVQFQKHKSRKDGLHVYCIECVNGVDRRYKHRSGVLKSRYGITLEEFEVLLAAQNYRCANCGKSGCRLFPDHDHKTGRIRGMLCKGCNTGIGMLGDTVFGLQRAIEYLQPAEPLP